MPRKYVKVADRPGYVPPEKPTNPGGGNLDFVGGPADKARRAAERKAARVAERTALWAALTRGAKMRRVMEQPTTEDVLPEEVALRKLYNKDAHGYIRELDRHEAEEKAGGSAAGTAPPAAGGIAPGEGPPAPDAGAAKLRPLIRGLLEEIARDAKAG